MLGGKHTKLLIDPNLKIGLVEGGKSVKGELVETCRKVDLFVTY